jgi:hypothetical protein
MKRQGWVAFQRRLTLIGMAIVKRQTANMKRQFTYAKASVNESAILARHSFSEGNRQSIFGDAR